MNEIELGRAWNKIERVPFSTCWFWVGSLNSDGYGTIVKPRVGGKMDGYRLAHRVFYEHYVGPIPVGLVIDHLCHEPCCVNPAHLEAVTQRENLLRGMDTLARFGASKTHCKRGHPLAEARPEAHYKGKDGVVRYQRRCHRCHVEARAARLANTFEIQARFNAQNARSSDPLTAVLPQTPDPAASSQAQDERK